MKTASEFVIKQMLRSWLQELANSPKNRRHSQTGELAATVEVDDHTPIIEQRIITSVQVMDLILYIERLKDEPVEIDSLKPGAFRDVDTIYANFFQGDQDERRQSENN